MTEGLFSGSPARDALLRLYSMANIQDPELQKRWVGLSLKLGPRLASRSIVTIQNLGNLDLILRALEKEFHPTPSVDPVLTLQSGLSEAWIGSAYEIFRIAKNKLPDDAQVRQIHDQLRLLRIPLEKYQISEDSKLNEPLKLVKESSDHEDVYLYDKTDLDREHVMPTGVSNRGSVQWRAIDLTKMDSSWIERLHLSEVILDYGDSFAST